MVLRQMELSLFFRQIGVSFCPVPSVHLDSYQFFETFTILSKCILMDRWIAPGE